MRLVRVWFSKTGDARYISHLDTVRTMTRALRRAGVPLWYTEGFNRHPYLTFAAPLSLGYEGLRECMDIKLEDDTVSLDEVARALDAAMPRGFAILGADEAVRKVNDLGWSIYELRFNCDGEQVKRLESAEELIVEKKGKKGTRPVDIRPLMRDIRLLGNVLFVKLPTSCESGINPAMVVTALRALTGDESIDAHILRHALLTADGEQFA